MKVGLIARGENRGLGIQTWEAYRHLHPDRTLLVDMGDLAQGFEVHRDRFPDATCVRFDHGQLPQRAVREWLDGLDVVLSCETLYDWRLATWGRDQGVATVVQLNPEFYVHGLGADPHPTRWWAPTPWRLDRLPKDTPVVPVPVATDRFPMAPPAPHGGPLQVLHVVGHGAAGDRNGTRQVLMALRSTRQAMHVRIVSQDRNGPRGRYAQGVTVDHVHGGVENYWDLYAGADVMVMPRRYGGLCLPVQEAQAAGLAVVMSDCEPNSWWPAVQLVRSRPRGYLRVVDGELPMYAAHPTAIAQVLDRWATDRDALWEQQVASVKWAEAHSWEALLGTYHDELAEAADRAAG